MAKVESPAWLEFVRERDELLQTKHRETARNLAEELVRLMELLAIHGSTGIDGDPDTRAAYILRLEARIGWAAHMTKLATHHEYHG